MNSDSQRPVIVVDDSDDDLALTVMLLRKVAGVSRIESFTDSEAAIESLSALEQRSANLPALIVLDVKMPKLSGLDVLEWIRAHRIFDSVPVVLWSSSDDPHDVERAAQLGAQCYVGKYPPVPTVEAMVLAAQQWSGIGGANRFFEMRGNLCLGRDPLPNLGSISGSGLR